MKLIELLNGVEIIDANVDFNQEITGIVTDSRDAKNNNAYIALQGKLDGHDFCNEANENGATVAICLKKVDMPCIVVDNTRIAYALMAANFYENAHKKMKVITITGTNGKTTTSYIINAILNENGHKTVVIGTLGAIVCGKKVKLSLTTPDPMQLHKVLFDAYKMGVEYVIMEASAHAIYYDKLFGIQAEIGVFTNISQDHLDFFNTMEQYSSAKTSYFDTKNMKFGIINTDDSYGRKLFKKNKNFLLSYGIDFPSDVFAMDIVSYDGKTRFIVNVFDEVADITIPLWGRFNIYNTLAAIAVTKSLSVPLDTIRKALIKLKEVEGRFNIIKSDITVIIDYAHTPDGLENLLKSVKTLEGGKTITVFGCGGDRDKTKRPIMGEIAATYSDFCVITSDNPRFEQPMTIINEVENGVVKKSQDYICIKNRQNAIAYAISYAKKGDKVVVAGKGGEDYIDIMGVKLPYSDKKAVKMALRSYHR